MKTNREKGLRPSAIFVIGVACAGLLLGLVFAVRHINILWNPTLKNTEYLLSRGKAAEAKALLDKMPLEKQHHGSRVHLLRGKALYALLIEQLRKERWGSYGINPDNWISHPLANEAEQCFLDAMAADPNDPEIRLVLGNLYREQGRFGDAENMFRAALELDDSNAEAFLAIGLLYAEGSRHAAARKALDAAWELDRGNPQIAKNIGYFYRFYQNDPEMSILWFSRYLNSNPRRDSDIGLVRRELKELIERYPEFVGNVEEPLPKDNSIRAGGEKFTESKRRPSSTFRR